MNWLQKEMEKDQTEIQNHKKKLIEDIKKLDKTKMFVKEQKKLSIIDKILLIFGYGEKG
jgi:hypothetical protein